MRYFRGGLHLVISALLILITVSGKAVAEEKVVLQLRWDHQFQFAGYYAALWQGFYKNAGLDVEIRSAFEPGGKYHNVAKEVAEGRAQYGTGGADILRARDAGAPLVVLATIFQQSPVAFYALAEKNVQSPADLTRLRVGTRGPTGIANVELRAMLRAENINPDMVKLQKFKERLGLFDLAKRNVDVASGFTSSAGWIAKELGIKITRLRPASYGVDFYGSAIFTHRDLIERNPEQVRKFTAASLKGWEYALTHATEIADRIAAELPRTIPLKDRKGFNRFQIEPIKNLTLYPIVELGATNPMRWRRMHDALKDSGLVTGALNVGEFIFDPELRQRARRDFVIRVIIVLLVIGMFMGIVGWIWALRRNLAERRAVEKALQESHGNLEVAVEERTKSLREQVTEREFAEQALQQSNDRLKDFAEIATDWMWETGPDLRYSYISPNTNNLNDSESNESIGMTRAELAEHRGWITDPDEWRSHLDDFENHRPFRNFEYADNTYSDEIAYRSSSAKPVFDESGEFMGYRGTSTDITKRKLAEISMRESEQRLKEIAEKFRTVFDSAADAIFIIDHSEPNRDRIVDVNLAACEMTGYSAAELLTMVVSDVSVGTSDEARLENDKQFESKSQISLKGVHRRKDGTTYPVSIRNTIFEDGGKEFALALVRDETDSKRVEDELRAAHLQSETARREAEAANRTKSQFLANMSHELRSPLTAVMGYAQMMLAETLGPIENDRYREYLANINSSAEHLNSLINDILDVSAIESGNVELHEDMVSYSAVAEASLQLVRPRADDAGLSLKEVSNDDLPLLFVDQRRLKQILVNLLSNAVKFTTPNGTVILEAKLTDTGAFQISVADTGIGMDEEGIAKALSKFGQVDGDLNRMHEGTGLGLPLSRELVELHGGVLEIQSQIGVGTTVSVQFPKERVIH